MDYEESTATIGAVDEEIVANYAQLNWYIADIRRRLEADALAGTTRGQGKVMGILQVHPHISQKELARILDIRAASVSELINKLSAKGLVRRQTGHSDHRTTIISLTPAGRATLKQYRQFGAALLVDLTEEERNQLDQIIRKLVSSVKSQYALTD